MRKLRLREGTGPNNSVRSGSVRLPGWLLFLKTSLYQILCLKWICSDILTLSVFSFQSIPHYRSPNECMISPNSLHDLAPTSPVSTPPFPDTQFILHKRQSMYSKFPRYTIYFHASVPLQHRTWSFNQFHKKILCIY